ncbi:MAG: 2-C-methyl-D-erythritol 2,4-cyclodiphosphate synthase [Ignavibacteria bacterium]
MTAYPRIGYGFDVHRFAEGRTLVLGGVEIPHHAGLEGHSDADVVLHALMDALLGAAALGDIGKHFPPSDPQYKGIKSLVLLARVRSLLAEQHFTIINADITLVMEQPTILPYIEPMRQKIASTLMIQPDQISIKATTNERLGFIGKQEGAAAHAVAAIVKNLLRQ